MYGLVPYNLSQIQKGIQYGHAVVEYSLEYGDTPEYQKWAKEDKTFIILNGGTTNNNRESKFFGSMNLHLETLKSSKLNIATFHEPDLGDQLTAIVFLVDERVWNKEEYPTSFEDYCTRFLDNPLDVSIEDYYALVGGMYNAHLKEFLNQFRLA